MELHDVYMLAKTCVDFDEFKSKIDYIITGNLMTVKSDNEFLLILKQD